MALRAIANIVRAGFVVVSVFSVALTTTGCSQGCPVEDHRYVKIENTLSADFEVEFRFSDIMYSNTRVDGPFEYRLETIKANETRTIDLNVLRSRPASKGGVIQLLCDTTHTSSPHPVWFSAATLSQVAICQPSVSSPNPDRKYRIQLIGAACPPDYVAEIDGWL